MTLVLTDLEGCVLEKVMAVPYEEDEQRGLAAWLDRRGLVWEYVPMDGSRTSMSGRKMRESGAKRGSADNRVYNRVPGRPWIRGIAIELKRIRGHGKESLAQQDRRKKMTEQGWLAVVCEGAEEAIRLLISLGL